MILSPIGDSEIETVKKTKLSRPGVNWGIEPCGCIPTYGIFLSIQQRGAPIPPASASTPPRPRRETGGSRLGGSGLGPRWSAAWGHKKFVCRWGSWKRHLGGGKLCQSFCHSAGVPDDSSIGTAEFYFGRRVPAIQLLPSRGPFSAVRPQWRR